MCKAEIKKSAAFRIHSFGRSWAMFSYTRGPHVKNYSVVEKFEESEISKACVEYITALLFAGER